MVHHNMLFLAYGWFLDPATRFLCIGSPLYWCTVGSSGPFLGCCPLFCWSPWSLLCSGPNLASACGDCHFWFYFPSSYFHCLAFFSLPNSMWYLPAMSSVMSTIFFCSFGSEGISITIPPPSPHLLAHKTKDLLGKLQVFWMRAPIADQEYTCKFQNNRQLGFKLP